jgi:hypothetical protein
MAARIKHDGFRVIARKTGAQVRLYSLPPALALLHHRWRLVLKCWARTAHWHLQCSFMCHSEVAFESKRFTWSYQLCSS